MTDSLRHALAFLEAHHVMALALAVDGYPHCCSLMYANQGFDLYWVSDPATRHSAIIDAQPEAEAGVTVAPDYQHFGDIRGLQMFGTATRVSSPAEVEAAMSALKGRFSLFREFSRAPVAVAMAMARARVYRFRPHTAVFIDNTAGFGTKAKFTTKELASVGG